MSEMPAAVLDRFAACQTVAFCGVFPELRRAWASVDSSLFLWRFDRWQDVPMEYSGEDQSIVAVGLAPARPGVFVSAIQHVLVVCTTTEILLVGACCGRSPGGTGDEWDQLTLAPLPLFSVPSDGVTTVTVTCTAGGRIFLGGADGNLYELQYQSSSGVAGRWRGGRPLTKVRPGCVVCDGVPCATSVHAPVPSCGSQPVDSQPLHLSTHTLILAGVPHSGRSLLPPLLPPLLPGAPPGPPAGGAGGRGAAHPLHA
ncbi:Nuclear pore complex protein Nup155 [Auxenochlorella protothecoides]|uniref:Nuclear pore complex protein Nup155 n=1 Tax=Auxenochlorella protothecoides TaxID=3075 RepID=A0A087SSH6_AUXPR|nr:Nuclear pore complex protein Nup155 [Auxenochlorella protothecoides]KFM28680.1 Nuclear pore complex protein Nup155 [Auxenochlorella protothecoides]